MTHQKSIRTVDRHKKIILIVISLLICLGLVVILNRIEHVRLISDFYSRWYATTKLIADGRSIYDPSNGIDVSAYKEGMITPIGAGFFYPAHLLVFLLPLSFLPFWLSNSIWMMVIQLFFLGSLLLMIRQFNWPSSPNQLGAFILLSLFFFPTIQNTIWAQFNTIGVIALGLCYVALNKERYALAGAWAVGLTFKPQVTLFMLLFLLLWAVMQRKRWPFLLGFAATGISMWVFAELLNPNWVFAFIDAVSQYNEIKTITLLSTVDGFFAVLNPFNILTYILIAGAFVTFIRVRKMTPRDPQFVAALCLGITVSWLVIPFVREAHLVFQPLIFVMLAGSLRTWKPRLFRYTVYGFIGLYFVGLAGFFYGLSIPRLYRLNTHVAAIEYVYKVITPIAITLLSGWIAWQATHDPYQTERLP